MNAAAACSIHAPEVALVDVGVPVVAVRRFDRRVRGTGRNISVTRLHQEDLAQALALTASVNTRSCQGEALGQFRPS